MRESRITAELKTGLLPDSTRRLFERLHGDPALAGFTLIGGSALTLQIGHRIFQDMIDRYETGLAQAFSRSFPPEGT